MSLRQYILALIAIPLVALLAVGGLKGLNDWNRFSNARTTLVETQEALLLTDFANYLQIERGQSAGFLTSGGASFGRELSATRRQVDEALVQASGLASNVQAQVAKLRDMRSSVDTQSTKVAQMGAFYTGIITGVLDAADEQLIQQGDPRIVKIGSGLVAVSAAKEAAGLQRAAGAAGFGAGQFELPVYRSFSEKGATEAQFLHVASIALRANIPGLDFQAELSRNGLRDIRQSVLVAGPGGDAPDINSQQWFQLATEWLNYLHDVEIMAANEMTDFAKAESRSALMTLVATGLIVILALAACCGIGLTLIRIFDQQFGALQEDLDRLACKDFDFEPAFIDATTEIGSLNRAMETSRATLQKAESDLAVVEADRSQVIASLDQHLQRLAGRDLDCAINERFPQDYEQLRSSFNTTVTTLSATVQQVVDAAGSIRRGATEISQASDNLSGRTESQAATLEETVDALDELTASVKSAAEGARSVETIMGEARQDAENSGKVVENAVLAMTEIAGSSNQISQIISMIDDIAFQTNLLALNAGVEAARAGEAGRGFAVVASEVRALAQRSSDAATEIKSLIDESSKQVDSGVELVGKAGDALGNIVDRVGHISKLVSDIAIGAVEQATGLSEINTGMVQLDQVTQQNATMAGETTAAGHLLNSDATNLAELVELFKTSGNTVVQLPTPQSVAEKKPALSIPTAHGDNTARDLWENF